jgi:hypothetical protein
MNTHQARGDAERLGEADRADLESEAMSRFSVAKTKRTRPRAAGPRRMAAIDRSFESFVDN